jgi:hypothetical protein
MSLISSVGDQTVAYCNRTMADQVDQPPPPRYIHPPALGPVDINRPDPVRVPSTLTNIYNAVEYRKKVELTRGK